MTRQIKDAARRVVLTPELWIDYSDVVKKKRGLGRERTRCFFFRRCLELLFCFLGVGGRKGEVGQCVLGRGTERRTGFHVLDSSQTVSNPTTTHPVDPRAVVG